MLERAVRGGWMECGGLWRWQNRQPPKRDQDPLLTLRFIHRPLPLRKLSRSARRIAHFPYLFWSIAASTERDLRKRLGISKLRLAPMALPMRWATRLGSSRLIVHNSLTK